MASVQPFLHANGGVGIAQGTNVGQRVGQKITIKSIEWMLRISGAASTSGTYGPMCIDVILDKQCNGTIVATADLYAHMLSGTPTAVADIAGSRGPRNLINSKRFVTIAKKVFQPVSLIYTAATSFSPNGAMVHGYKKVNIPIEYGLSGSAPTDGAVAQIKSNNLYIVISYSSPGASGNIDVQLFTRTRYQD